MLFLRHRHKIIPLLLALCCTSACSFWTGPVEEPKEAEPSSEISPATPAPAKALPETSSVEVKELVPPKKQPTHVEIIWAVPKEQVDSYVIRYGYDISHLDQQVIVYRSALHEEKHAKHGSVFRYVIEKVKPGRQIYVSMWSVRGDESSAPTAVMEAQGE